MSDWTDEQWEEFYGAQEERDDEAINAYSLSKVGVLNSDYFNTFMWLKDYQKIEGESFAWPLTSYLIYENEIEPEPKAYLDFETLSNHRAEHEINEGLDEAWNKLGYSDSNIPDWAIGHNRTPNLIELATKNYYMYGMYPPPVLMKSIFKCFELYFEAEGELSLEEVFFGKPKKRAGNYARRRGRNLKFIEFHYQLLRNNVWPQDKMSALDFARKLIKSRVNDEWEGPIDVLDEQAENFIREYQRWKKININDK
tara:strand:- start:1134 stop:1895 length:762 start_codon:yes stop_codon:yes gene_type:complete